MNFEALNNKTTFYITYPVIKETKKEKFSWCDCLRKINILIEEFDARIKALMKSIMQREKDTWNRCACFGLTPSASEKLQHRALTGIMFDNQGGSVSAAPGMLPRAVYLRMRELAICVFKAKREDQLYLSRHLIKNIRGRSVSAAICMTDHDLRLDIRKIVARTFKVKRKGNLCLLIFIAKNVKKKPNDDPRASHHGHFKAYPWKRIHADDLFFARSKPLWRSYRETVQMRKNGCWRAPIPTPFAANGERSVLSNAVLGREICGYSGRSER